MLMGTITFQYLQRRPRPGSILGSGTVSPPRLLFQAAEEERRQQMVNETIKHDESAWEVFHETAVEYTHLPPSLPHTT